MIRRTPEDCARRIGGIRGLPEVSGGHVAVGTLLGTLPLPADYDVAGGLRADKKGDVDLPSPASPSVPDVFDLEHFVESLVDCRGFKIFEDESNHFLRDDLVRRAGGILRESDI